MWNLLKPPPREVQEPDRFRMELPDAYWDQADVPQLRDQTLHGVHRRQWMENSRVEFYFWIGHGQTRGVLWHHTGGELFSRSTRRRVLRVMQQQIFDEFAPIIHRELVRYHWLRALAARNAELEALARPVDEAWLAALQRRTEEVIAAIRSGQMANLDDWTDAVPPSPAEAGVLASECDDKRRSRRAAALHEAKKAIATERYKIEILEIQWEKQRQQEIEEARRLAQQAKWDAEAAEREAERQRIAAEQQRIELKLAGRIDLPADGHPDGIIFGTLVDDASDLVVPVKAMQHMLVGGTTGAGKSVFLQQIVWQLVHSAEVERVVILDLKGGVEFFRYRDNPRVEIVWEFPGVIRVVNALVELMAKRQEIMRQEGTTSWQGQRTFVVIDEYAEIQADIDAAYDRAEKGLARQLSANLVRIARRARALGLVLICALQKPTLDAMDSALRSNLNCRICLRVNSRQQAVAVLDDLDDAPLEPRALPTGRFIYSDLSRGIIEYAQTQIAPGVQLGEDT